MSALSTIESVVTLLASLVTEVNSIKAQIASLEAKVAAHDQALQHPQPPGPPALTSTGG